MCPTFLEVAGSNSFRRTQKAKPKAHTLYSTSAESAARQFRPQTGLAGSGSSGVMGGSQTASSKSLGIPMESQDYRGQIRAAILAADEAANIVDPLEMGAVRGRELGFGEGKPSWTDDADVRKLFAEVVDAAAAADVVVSYLPTASMGSAC